MKHILATICVLGFVAFTASAYALPEEESALDPVFDSERKATAEQAIIVGEILREVARQLDEDDAIKAENDEYFFKAMWEKAKSALKNATAKVKVAVKGAYKDAKTHIQSAAKDAKKKATETVADILSKILGKLGRNYALEDAVSHENIVKDVCASIARVGQRLVEQGQSLLESENPRE